MTCSMGEKFEDKKSSVQTVAKFWPAVMTIGRNVSTNV
jgi:hypothetical protein